jgi:hypothetical protein
MKVFSPVAALLVGIVSAQAAYAGCSGNACSAGYLTKQGDCMVVVNNSDRPIKFTQGIGHAPTVYPHSTERILSFHGAASGNGQCMRSLGKDYTLNFAD